MTAGRRKAMVALSNPSRGAGSAGEGANSRRVEPLLSFARAALAFACGRSPVPSNGRRTRDAHQEGCGHN